MSLYTNVHTWDGGVFNLLRRIRLNKDDWYGAVGNGGKRGRAMDVSEWAVLQMGGHLMNA